MLMSTVYGRFPIAIDEKEGDLVPKKDVTSLCDTMRSLEKTLTQLSKDPPMKGGEELMKQLRTYNQACFHLLELCKSDANEKSKAFKVGNDLFERGGPEFVDEAVNEQVIMQKFEWDKTTLEEMLHARKKTNALWFDLWRLYNNVDISG
ncbi:uncharacterized protein LOC128995307 [Macrosteles quadrilineatus]|uniref:uncharacterized protein LOC128995307 n=1 Tax=Macrosteles quadrilineatus TaxID=74068 RepID=UPI0023E17BA1|nr:uncharacterized protein LOC128995307 [Macrosteles quadrilineatus]